VPYGDGDLADYLDSLDKMQDFVRAGKVDELVPAHGFPIDQPIKAIEGYRAHRQERLTATRRVVAEHGLDARAVVQSVYGDIDDPVLLRASYSVTYAQLEYLARELGREFHPDLSLIAMTPENTGRVLNGETD
jgi:glyoxylase-like metal-dependent hydrolase (beta-lactamase superfamily II)